MKLSMIAMTMTGLGTAAAVSWGDLAVTAAGSAVGMATLPVLSIGGAIALPAGLVGAGLSYAAKFAYNYASIPVSQPEGMSLDASEALMPELKNRIDNTTNPYLNESFPSYVEVNCTPDFMSVNTTMVAENIISPVADEESAAELAEAAKVAAELAEAAKVEAAKVEAAKVAEAAKVEVGSKPAFMLVNTTQTVANNTAINKTATVETTSDRRTEAGTGIGVVGTAIAAIRGYFGNKKKAAAAVVAAEQAEQPEQVEAAPVVADTAKVDAASVVADTAPVAKKNPELSESMTKKLKDILKKTKEKRAATEQAEQAMKIHLRESQEKAKEFVAKLNEEVEAAKVEAAKVAAEQAKLAANKNADADKPSRAPAETYTPAANAAQKPAPVAQFVAAPKPVVLNGMDMKKAGW